MSAERRFRNRRAASGEYEDEGRAVGAAYEEEHAEPAYEDEGAGSAYEEEGPRSGYADEGTRSGHAHEDDEEPGPAGRSRGLTAAAAAQAGLRQIAGITAKVPEGVTSVEPTEDGWLVQVEILEDRRIPSSSDVIGLYEVEMDESGTLLSYRRRRRYPRGRGDSEVS